MARSPWSRLCAASLGVKLIAFSALVSTVVVALTFVALTLELRVHTRDLLAQTLAQHQRMLADLHTRRLGETVRASILLSENPTLLAAMETYRLEEGGGSAHAEALLATIQVEVEKIAGGLATDLLIVTGPDGVVLARAGTGRTAPGAGEDLSRVDVVRHALSQETPVDRRNFAVMRLGDSHFQVGCVPILLQGFIAGSLTLGESIDQSYAERLGDSFATEVVAVAGGRILGTTLRDPARLEAIVPASAALVRSGAPGGASVLTLAGEDFVAVPLTVGRDEQDDTVTLLLLSSLSGALVGSNRSLLFTLAAYGFLVVAITGLSAAIVSRNVLRPLESLVEFMRSRAATGDRSGRFAAPRAGTEVRVLADTFNDLMDSLEAHERRLLEKAREDLDRLERLKESEKLAELGRMLSGAAHEINNPMTGVIGHIELLLQRQGIDEDVRRRLDEVRRQGHRVVTLTRNLLRVARRDQGQRSPVDLHQILRETVALRQRDYERAGLAVDLAVLPSSLTLTANELELSQVFLNLVGNAYDALKDAGGSRTLRISASDSGEAVTIVFSDDGPGLKDPARVFEYFYTTKPLGKGTGLGLGISRAIVESHGGRITAENNPGGGARFTIVIPRVETGGGECSIEAPAADPQASRRPLPATILVVDDEPVVRDLQLAILGSLGARAVAAPSCAAAIDQLLRQDFDLIVADLMVDAAVSGKALFEWASRYRDSGASGIVFLSGEVVADEEFLKEGNLRCLRKPFEMEEYVRTLREVWDEMHPC